MCFWREMPLDIWIHNRVPFLLRAHCFTCACRRGFLDRDFCCGYDAVAQNRCLSHALGRERGSDAGGHDFDCASRHACLAPETGCVVAWDL